MISCSCTCLITPSVHLPRPSTNNVKGARNRSQSSLNLDHSIASESKHDHWFQLSLISIFPPKDCKILLKSESHPNLFPSTLPPPKLAMYMVCFKPKSQTRVRKQWEYQLEALWFTTPQPKKRSRSYIYAKAWILFYFYFHLTPSIPSAKSSLPHTPALVTMTWGWEAGATDSQTHRVVLCEKGFSRVKKQLRIFLAAVTSSTARGESQMNDYYTPTTSPGFLAWPVWFDQKLECHSKTLSCVGDMRVIFQPSPFPRMFSLSLCFLRTHPFSQFWLPSLYAPEWPSLILSSSHLDGGLLIRPSGLLITTVSLSFAKPQLETRDRKATSVACWEYCQRCFWMPCPGSSSGSCVRGLVLDL